jgi:hypothetical protein
MARRGAALLLAVACGLPADSVADVRESLGAPGLGMRGGLEGGSGAHNGAAGRRNGSHPAPGEGLNDLGAATDGLEGCGVSTRRVGCGAPVIALVLLAFARRRVARSKRGSA